MIDSKDIEFLGTQLKYLTRSDLYVGNQIWFCTTNGKSEWVITLINQNDNIIQLREMERGHRTRTLLIPLNCVVDNRTWQLLIIDSASLYSL